MLGNDRIETASTEVTSIRRRSDIEKSTWRTHRYFVDFESRIHVEISTSNRYHNLHVDSPFKIDVMSTNFPRGMSTSNRWRIDEDVSIGSFLMPYKNKYKNLNCSYGLAQSSRKHLENKLNLLTFTRMVD